MSLLEDCEIIADLAKDEVITRDHVKYPVERLADVLRAEQINHFNNPG
jgi:predicted homoserine dehydrogenase-like protein